MLNVGTGEIILIAVVALLVLGPKRMPELARGIGKFMREFRRQTDDVRQTVEREFYKMDQEMDLDAVKIQPPAGIIANDALPAPTMPESSQLTAGMPDAAGLPIEPVTVAEPVITHTPFDESDPAHPDHHRAELQQTSADPVSSSVVVPVDVGDHGSGKVN